MPAVYPPVIVPAEFRGHYPHMARRDAVIWTRFLAAQPAPFLGFAYDVALGGQRIEGLEMPEQDLLGWQYNTALKIDAVGLTADEAWVIEVRPHATVSALGAAYTYALVADRDAVFELPLRPVIVCEGIQPDVQWACERLGVRVVRVQMLLLELFSGSGTVSHVFRNHGWDALTVDADPAMHPDVECRIETFRYRGPSPDLVWASPPCTTFSQAVRLGRREPSGADLPLLELTRRKILSWRPRYWILENVAGLVEWWPDYAQRIGPWYLWGHFPPIPDPGPVYKHAETWMRTAGSMRARGRRRGVVSDFIGDRPARRAAIPRALAEAVYQALAQKPALFE